MGRIGSNLEFGGFCGFLVQGCESDRCFAIVSLSTLKLGESAQTVEAREGKGRRRKEGGELEKNNGVSV